MGIAFMVITLLSGIVSALGFLLRKEYLKRVFVEKNRDAIYSENIDLYKEVKQLERELETYKNKEIN